MSGMLTLIDPGLSTSVQDLGRSGHQHLGVPVSGTLDPTALRLANALVGNEAATACLEMRMTGPTFRVEAESARIAAMGGSGTVRIEPDGTCYRFGRSVRVTRSQTVHVTLGADAATACLAVSGGFALEPVLDSLSTYLRGGFGGFEGRALAAEDRLPLARAHCEVEGDRILSPEPGEKGRASEGPVTLRVVLGPQQDYFTDAALSTFLGETFRVSSQFDRMGLRLEGAGLDHARGHDITSDGIATGCVQVPGDGVPILLLADRQTTGGYPKIATVISADLPAAARLKAGDALCFSGCSPEAAIAARREAEEKLAHRIAGIAPLPTDARCLASQYLRSHELVGTDPREKRPATAPSLPDHEKNEEIRP